MSNHDKDRIEGSADQLKGALKEKVGDATGNEQAQAEGKFDQLKGKLKEGVADVKDKVDDLVDGNKQNAR